MRESYVRVVYVYKWLNACSHTFKHTLTLAYTQTYYAQKQMRAALETRRKTASGDVIIQFDWIISDALANYWCFVVCFRTRRCVFVCTSHVKRCAHAHRESWTHVVGHYNVVDNDDVRLAIRFELSIFVCANTTHTKHNKKHTDNHSMVEKKKHKNHQASRARGDACKYHSQKLNGRCLRGVWKRTRFCVKLCVHIFELWAKISSWKTTSANRFWFARSLMFQFFLT